MSSARTGAPPATPCVWSAAQALTRRPARGDQLSSVQPEPPPCAFASATNPAFQRATLPKSRSNAAARAPAGSPPPPSPSPSKYTSCRIIEFIAMSSSRLSPLISKTGAVVVLVMAEEQPVREALQPMRLERQRRDFIVHDCRLPMRVASLELPDREPSSDRSQEMHRDADRRAGGEGRDHPGLEPEDRERRAEGEAERGGVESGGIGHLQSQVKPGM